ncbi:MAG TPA: hypothetical protein VFD70_23175 [Anaerolineae bacterium]|nr:hypothetical protein [Anaerolineae bacterium]
MRPANPSKPLPTSSISPQHPTRDLILGFGVVLLFNLILLPLLAVLVFGNLHNEPVLVVLVLVPLILNIILLLLVYTRLRGWLVGALIGTGLLLLTLFPVWFCISAMVALGS